MLVNKGNVYVRYWEVSVEGDPERHLWWEWEDGYFTTVIRMSLTKVPLRDLKDMKELCKRVSGGSSFQAGNRQCTGTRAGACPVLRKGKEATVAGTESSWNNIRCPGLSVLEGFQFSLHNVQLQDGFKKTTHLVPPLLRSLCLLLCRIERYKGKQPVYNL